MSARALDDGETFALPLSKIAVVVGEQLGVTENAIERCAQLMAHIADEDALGLICGLGHELRGSHFFFDFFAPPDLLVQFGVDLFELLLVAITFQLRRTAQRKHAQYVEIRIGPIPFA